MKFVVYGVLICMPQYAGSACCPTVNPQLRQLQVLTKYLERNLAPKAVPAKKLAPFIIKLSKQYGVDPMLVARVLILESRGLANATNGSDFGIMQVNYKHGISRECLYNWRCNLTYGARYLARATRPCQYNLGLNRNLTKYSTACARYERKLAVAK